MSNTTHSTAGAESLPAQTENGRKPHHADDQSFMRKKKPKGGGIDYWVVTATGSYGADCEKGRALGREFLAYIGQHPTNGNATLLGCIVNDMVKSVQLEGRLSGIEIAFLASVNEYALIVAKAMATVEGGAK